MQAQSDGSDGLADYERHALVLAQRLGWKLDVEDFRQLSPASWAALVRWGGEVAENGTSFRRVQTAWSELRAKGLSPEEAISRVGVWLILHTG